MDPSQWQKDVLVVCLAVTLGLVGYFFTRELSITEIFTWFVNPDVFNVYLAGFIITFIGNASILFPIAYAAAIPLLASEAFSVHPFILGVVCGVSAGLGEMTAYLVGYLSGKKMSKEAQENLRHMKEKFGRSKPFLIFLAGVLPIPDEFVIVPLASAGPSRYPFSKTFLFSTLGKLVLCLFLSYAGYFYWNWALTFLGPSALSFTILAPSFVILFYLFIRIDWEKRLS